MTSDRKWTVDDVQRLVEAARIASSMMTRQFPETVKVLTAALAPFLPDPDAELVEKMAWKYCETVGGTENGIQKVAQGMREVLALAREHDAKAVAK